MGRLLFSALFIICITFSAGAQSFFHQADQFFGKYVEKGMVDYESIKNSQGPFKRLVDVVASYNLENSDEVTEKAFWINAYNIMVIKEVLNHYPVGSPMDINGMFDQIKHRVAGENLTLNEIENQMIRAQYQDARIHFVLVCAAISCPPIIDEAYQPDKLNRQLQMQTKKALNDPEFIRVHPQRKKVGVSEIFKWYREDFTDAGSIIDYINQFRRENIPDSYQVDYYTYNWDLNDYR